MSPEDQQAEAQRPKTQQHGIVAGVAAYLVWGALTLYWRHLEDFDAVGEPWPSE